MGSVQMILLGFVVAAVVLSANIAVTAISGNLADADKERAKLNVINYDSLIDKNGSLNIVGFVKNTSKEALMVPMMKLKLFNKQGEVIYKINSDPLVHFMNPGSVAPFKIIVTDSIRSKQMANFKIVFDKPQTQPLNPKPAKLTVENIEFFTDESNVTRIKGDIRNDGSKATDAFSIAVAFMNQKNQVLDVRVMNYYAPVITGAKVSFNMEYKQQADKYCLVADSRYYVTALTGVCEITGKKITAKSTKDVTIPRSSNNLTASQYSEETVKLSKFKVLDANKAKLRQIYVGQEIHLQSKATNNLNSVQPFTYIAQIKDQEGITVMLESIEGQLSPQKQSRLAVKWLPEEPGKYTVEIFVWKNLEDPSPLTAQPMKTSTEVKNKKA